MFFPLKRLLITTLFFYNILLLTPLSFAQSSSKNLDSIFISSQPYFQNQIIETSYILPFPKSDIDSILSDCACLNLEIQEENDKTIATGKFHPYKPGHYEKSWTIILKDKNQYQLKLAGQLTTERKVIESGFKYKINDLSFNSKQIDFGKITREGVVSKKITFHNHSGDTIEYFRNNSPENIEIVFSKNKIDPTSNHTFTVYFNPKDTSATHLGYNNQFVGLIFKMKEKEIITPINISSTIVPSPFQIENNYGKIHISSLPEDEIRLKEGDEIIRKVSVKNTGNTPLHIQYFEPNNGVEILSDTPITINPRERVLISFKVLDIGRTGKQSRSFNIYSDDKQSPVSEVVYRFKLRKIKS